MRRACHRTHTAAGETGAGFGRSGQAVSEESGGWSRGAGLRTVIESELKIVKQVHRWAYRLESLYAACNEKTAKASKVRWLRRYAGGNVGLPLFAVLYLCALNCGRFS